MTAGRTTEEAFIGKLDEFDGRLLDHSIIDPIRYHAALVDVAPARIQELLKNPEIGLATLDDVMVLRPQSLVSDSMEGSLEDATETGSAVLEEEPGPPVVALLDGMPMTQHDRLANRLIVEDPDDFADRYGTAAAQRRHSGTAPQWHH